MDLYVGGLYVAEKVSDGQAVINADEPQAITLHITSGMITSERMTEATMDGFKSSTDGDLSAIQSDVDQFMSVFQRSEEHTSELQSRPHLVCRLLLEKKK